MFNEHINSAELQARTSSAITDAQQTRQTAMEHLKGSAFSRVWSRLEKAVGAVPEWARKHHLATQQLEEVVALYHRAGRELPAELVTALSDSRDVIAAMSGRVNLIGLGSLSAKPGQTVAGSAGLLTTAVNIAPIPKSGFEWAVNFGLMFNAYKRAESVEMKREIGFLMLNYLAKAAPISMSRLAGLIQDPQALQELEDLFQLGYYVDHAYHREGSGSDQLFSSVLSTQLAEPLRNSEAFMLDTTEIDALYPLSFTPIDLSVEKGGQHIAQAVLDHLRQTPDDAWSQQLVKGMVIDLTSLLGATPITGGDPTKEAAFSQALRGARKEVQAIVGAAVAAVSATDPVRFANAREQDELHKFISTNLQGLCRAEVRSVAVITTVPLFEYSLVNIGDFINLTGLRIGGVSARQHINDFLDIDQVLRKAQLGAVDYSVHGSQDTLYFPRLSDFARMQLLARFESNMNAAEGAPAILGRATVKLVRGLLGSITEERWAALNRDPSDLQGADRADHLARRTLLQSSLYRLSQHLAAAENSYSDFTTFTSAIELAQYEIATLLELTAPLDPQTFSSIYTQQLSCVPDELRPLVVSGLTKSAMNTFAGVCSAVMQSTPKAQMVHGEDSYFEEIYVLGKNRGINEVLAAPGIAAVDLYVGEFNHNINIHEDYHHYTPGDVIGDVERLLLSKPAEHLTVAIDSTIDLLDSPKARAFLTRFSKEIQDGRLNVVFFRSGQKFEMLGMDNYYGAPFYMVNNGGAHWKPFDALGTAEAFKTDPLSQQWFCLVNRYAASDLDAYRAAIFANSRDLLKRVPAELREPTSAVRVSTVDPGMDPAFIDIKITGPNKIDRSEIEELFYQKMAEHGRKAHSRGSFGFYHPNFNFIDGTTLRINPGLDPADNAIIEEVLKAVVALLRDRS